MNLKIDLTQIDLIKEKSERQKEIYRVAIDNINKDLESINKLDEGCLSIENFNWLITRVKALYEQNKILMVENNKIADSMIKYLEAYREAYEQSKHRS